MSSHKRMWKLFDVAVRNGSRRFVVNSTSRLLICRRFSSWSPTSEDSQYLQRSSLPTYHFQKGLLRLPIPELKDTCNRYLDSLKPIVSEKQFFDTMKIVTAFQTHEGVELQNALKEHDKQNKHTNYISEPWFDMYLSARTPLPVNYNPFMSMQMDPDGKFNDQLTRATNLVISIGRFKRSLDEQVLNPEIFHANPKKSDTNLFRTVCRLTPPSLSFLAAASLFSAYPLDMSQYESLFNTARIPRRDKDELIRHSVGRHFVVLRQGHFFIVDLFDDTGRVRSPTDVRAALGQILALPLTANPDAIGAFTTMERNGWADVRQSLVDGGNATSLTAVDDALFVLCLDDAKTTNPKEVASNLLCGADASNRWFDKSFSLIVDKNGLSTVNFEHSWGDGVAVMRLVEEIFKDSKRHFVSPDEPLSAAAEAPKKIDFKLSDKLKGRLANAKTDHLKVGDSLGFASLEYFDMNRDTIKTHKLSPDMIMQLAIQIAYHRLSGGAPVATYESCSTAAFRKGRTETMRPATAQTKRLVAEFLKPQEKRPSAATLRPMFDDCSKLHAKLVREASLGKGFDRHLLGLRVTAQRLGLPVPALFSDPNFLFANHFILSTSTLSTDTIYIGGFGPVVPDGYGIGYNVTGQKLGCIASAYKATRDTEQLVGLIKQSLDDIREVLEKTKGG